MVKDITTQNEQMKSYLLKTIRSTLHTKKKSNYDNIDSGDRSDDDDDDDEDSGENNNNLKIKNDINNNDDYNNNIADNSTMSILYLFQVGVWHTLVGNSYFR